MNEKIIEVSPLPKEKPLVLLEIDNKLYIYQGEKRIKEVASREEFDFYYLFKYKQYLFDMINERATKKNVGFIGYEIFNATKEKNNE